MTSQTDIPEGLTDDEINFIFQDLDTVLNTIILAFLLHGIYTGVLAVTLWTNYMNKSRPIRNVMIIVIILIYTLTSIGFALNWSFVHSAFITVTNGQNFWTVYLKLTIGTNDKLVLSIGITGTLCTILADSVTIWRCGVIWGRNWLIVLLPTLCLVSSIELTPGPVFKTIDMYMMFTNGNDLDLLYRVLYVSFTLVTTIWCTLGIVYHILSIGGNLRAYRRTIEILVESSTLYSVALILYVAFFAHNDWDAGYLDSVATASAKPRGCLLCLFGLAQDRKDGKDKKIKGLYQVRLSKENTPQKGEQQLSSLTDTKYNVNNYMGEWKKHAPSGTSLPGWPPS
ncbi:uncharacterized protein EV420DRAFT_1743898 [Desarmillaria tabescens]|uniref:Uncharacterized protein n=1 Tax=Armillaria tabescens TaxID=1929756 RepID=A0AA39U307_ARMTA|nr:uncharacterized protein EV420DRAFT_1743898 [Desarmillaria tabescens]KAK0466020.1 hypothetical protein EV420DRAFT_1743898 [Desarmillaria tabescens]